MSTEESTKPPQTRAPWTPEQVEALKRWQACPWVHPFTCGGCSNRDGLTPTGDGWRCPDCDYRQDWAWSFMLDAPSNPYISLTDGPLRRLCKVLSHVARQREHHLSGAEALEVGDPAVGAESSATEGLQ